MARIYDRRGQETPYFTTDSRKTKAGRTKGARAADKATKIKNAPVYRKKRADRIEKKGMTYKSVMGTMVGKQVDTTKAPKFSTVNKPKKAANIKKGSKIYTDGSTSEPYVLSPAHQPSLRQNEKMKEDMRKDAKNKKLGPDMSRGTVKRKTNKTVYQDSKPNKSNAPRPEYKKKKMKPAARRFRAGPTMTSMKNKYF
tara:strand:- start:50 stop:640 length:591 start_codon:yes stop_codon:yes gene_type:complete